MMPALSVGPKVTIVIVALCLCAYPLGRCHGARAERDRMASAALDLGHRNAVQHGKAADQRAQDDAHNQSEAQERQDAFKTAPDARPSDARRRFNCQRLRQSGADSTRLSACRGPEGA